jgi:hypothetical protein
MHPRAFRFLSPVEDPVVGSQVQAVRFLAGAALLLLPASSWAATAGSVLLTVGETRGEFWSGGHPQLGLVFSCGPHFLPVQLTAHAAASYWADPINEVDDGPGFVNYTIEEAGLGARGVWSNRIAHISLGAGPAWGRYHLEEDPAGAFSVTYQGTGWWAGGDALIRAGSHFGLGGGARYSRIEYNDSFHQYAWSYHGSLGWLWGSNR